uniref:Uncharacterized protein n=1 Tax=Fibrocapsa japonica TaxID=94617 RepID=A0A7S2V4V0_9STRA|mmetsp:Transcript_74/g.120  ORF Transcript_74/g.120 Transcript_74/m.120 type:complete len:135 (+) Transcript_74:83-487(+)|eukprot:CAMPEP_0113933814 /NCGR_PEP_ID=MMETSP1339-20121228/1134_1 /TAXON_ID=94617 /ORGANISM="Fibrocapsa japonica" /LENGTH=134 /DNA_ID=CAMNT_0000935293 /DNA_START=77 /DNA_END=481 /DNA_ORIENTATION=+ /assembly_acc=CAM_ASM_000762
MAEGYDPKRSSISEDALATFLRNPITGDITQVPGIGKAAAAALASADDDEPITNSFQLIGKFLLMKGPDTEEGEVDCVMHCNKFWYYLKSKGVNSHRSGIVHAIAEKINTMIPGIYDSDVFEDEDEDEEDKEDA